MRIQKRALTVSLLLLFATCLFADSFRHLNIENGLSNRKVFQIAKDTTGFMWFFTYMGVDRYDGTEIRHYILDEKLEAKNHILNSTVMVNDRAGNLWISLRNGKVYSYNEKLDKFDTRVDASQLLSGEHILFDILFDHQNRLWLCFSSGLYIYDPIANELSLVQDFQGEQVTRIEQYQEDVFYVGTSEHIYRLNVKMSDYILKSSSIEVFPIESRIEYIFIDKHQVYVGTFSNSAYVINTETNKITSLSHIIPSVPIRSITATQNHEILIATDGSGLYSISPLNQQLLHHYTSNEDDPSSIGGNTVSSIYVDERNCIWVSTSTNGISILDPQYPDIQWTRHEFMNSNSLLSNHVNTLLEDSDGDIWYGTNDGVSLYQTSINRWTHFLNNIDYAHVVLALSEDDQKNIWVGGFGIGAYKIHKPTRQIQKVPIRKENMTRGVSTEYIYSIYSDNQYIWFGGIEGDLTRYNKQDNIYDYYPVDCIGDIKPGNDTSLLLATCEALCIFNKINGKIEWYKEFNGKPLRFPIRCLLQTSTGEIWMATDGDGLISFNPQTNKSVFYTTENGLGSNSVNNLQEDQDGRIWFTTEKDLYCVNTQTQTISEMNEFINVEWGSFNPNASIGKKNRALAFGTANGSIEFSPSFSFESKIHPLLLFTDFNLFNKPVIANKEASPLKEAVNKTDLIYLKYSQNTFSFNFSALNFTYPNQIEYQYKLEDFDEEWRSARNGRIAEYTNIPSGKYTFQLKAIHKFTRQEIGYKQIHVTVGKPFWLSSWALMLYAFIILSIVIFVSYKIAKQIQEQQEREEFDLSIQKARIHDILQDKEQSHSILATTDTSEDEIAYPSEQDKEFHENALKIIEHQLSSPDFSVNEFCQELGMSRTSVYTRIKALTDQAPQDFIRTIRLKKAKELLKSKKYTIGEVALMVGFSDPKYFSTSFKKQFGVSPSKAE